MYVASNSWHHEKHIFKKKVDFFRRHVWLQCSYDHDILLLSNECLVFIEEINTCLWLITKYVFVKKMFS